MPPSPESVTHIGTPLPVPPAGLRWELRGWALLAVGALAIAGVLALLLALSRTPRIQDWLPWDDGFFHRGLVTHVIFSFEVWFLAILGLFAASASRAPSVAGRLAPALAVGGAVVLLIPTLANQGTASLNNYVPVLIHPLYIAGLLLLCLGVGIAVLRQVPLMRRTDDTVVFAIRIAGLIFIMALLCFAIAFGQLPADTTEAQFYERLFWGGGHVLQFVNTVMMMLAWEALARLSFARAPLSPPLSRAAYAVLGLAALAAPLLMLRHDVLGLDHRLAFTDMLWYALPLPPLVMGLGVLRLFIAHRTQSCAHPPARLALFLSLLVFGLGGAAGFFLGVADTRTPSHYHAVIGGVNLAFMGLFHVWLLPALGRPPRQGRLLSAQYHLYGWGQALHALGFYLAGAAGVARKTAGAGQGLDSIAKIASMGAVGLGGAIAVLGGILFVWTALASLLKRGVDHA